MTENKPWTLADEEKLKQMRAQIAELEAARNTSISEIQAQLLTFFNKECHAHQYDYRGIANLVSVHRWALIEILTGGAYSTLLAVKAFSER